MNSVNFKCQKCGLSNEDRDRTCKIRGDEIDIFPDEGEVIRENDEWVHRFETSCLAMDVSDGWIVVDVDPDTNLDYLRSAVETYATQLGLDADLVEWEVLRIRGKFQDCIAYDGFYIGQTVSRCVAELDKAAAGQPYGKSLDNWE